MVGAFAVGPVQRAHLNPAVTVGFWIAGDIPGSDVPEYFAGEFVGAFIGAHPRVAGVSGPLEETEDPGLKLACFSTAPAIRNPVANMITEIIGTFVLVFGDPRVLRQRGDGRDGPRAVDRRSAGARHRALARWSDRLRDQPGPRPRAAHHARDPADRRQGPFRLGLRLDPGCRAAIGGALGAVAFDAFFPGCPAALCTGGRRLPAPPCPAPRKRGERDGEVRGSDRSGHHQQPLHGVRPRGQRGQRRPEGARADLSQAGLGRARSAEIWARTQEVVDEAIASAGASADDVAGVGITNQRETAVVWDKTTGKPIHNALVWQDTRTDKLVDEYSQGRRPGPLPGEGRPPARDLLLRARRSAGCSTTSPTRRRRRSRATCCSATWTPG